MTGRARAGQAAGDSAGTPRDASAGTGQASQRDGAARLQVVGSDDAGLCVDGVCAVPGTGHLP